MSTLANVVTTLATMDNKEPGSSGSKDHSTSNGNSAPENSTNNSAAQAFDALAKAITPKCEAGTSRVSHIKASLLINFKSIK